MKPPPFKYKFTLFILLIGLLWISFNKSGLLIWSSFNNERKLLIQEIERLIKEEEEIKVHLEKLENDLDYIEFIAYSKFKMVRPGEKIYRVKDYKRVK